MRLQLNYASGIPVYLQLVEQIKAAAAAGSIRVGDPLPSVRVLAEELRINRNTIAKAYTELEHEGIVESFPGRGCFVKTRGSSLKKAAREQRLAGDLDALIVQAHHLQISEDELRRLLDERLDRFHETRREHEV